MVAGIYASEHLSGINNMRMTRLHWILGLLILFVVGLVLLTSKPYPSELSTTELARLDTLRRAAYDMAMTCSKTTTPKLKYEEIDWVVIPDSRLRIRATDGSITLGGWFSPRDSIIYLPYPNRDRQWILVHESLHAIGYIGHPDIPFKYPCGVMGEQN